MVLFCLPLFHLQWACTNEIANSSVFKSGCLFTTGELSSTKFSDTGFTIAPGTVLTHRIDGGKSNVNAHSTNPNDAHGLTNVVFANNCATDHPDYPTPMFKQGTDFYRLDTKTQQLLCDNEADDEAAMIYFACCDLTSKVCVDPLIETPASGSTEISSGPSSSSSSGSSGISMSSVVGIAVGASVGGGLVALGGAFVVRKAFLNQASSQQQEEQLEHVDMPQSL